MSDRNAKFELVPRAEGLQPILLFYAVSVTVDLSEPALGSDLVNQTDPHGNQNDPVNANRFSKYAMAQLIFKVWCVQFRCKFVQLIAYNMEPQICNRFRGMETNLHSTICKP